MIEDKNAPPNGISSEKLLPLPGDTGLINKLTRVCSSTDWTKHIYTDLNLKELLMRDRSSINLYH